MTKARDPDLFGYTGEDEVKKLARRSDPHTSYEAAEAVLPKLHSLRRQVHDLLMEEWKKGDGGLTDYEIEEHFGDHGSTYRTRRAELTAMGFVEDTGKTRIIKGRARKIWRIA